MSNEFEERLSAGERELENALRTLKPAVDVDAIACAYAAGAASANRSLRTWRAAAAVLAIGFGAMAFISMSQDSSSVHSPGVATSLPARQEVLTPARSSTSVPATHISVAIHASDAGRYPRLGTPRFDGEADGFDANKSGPDNETPPVRVGDSHWSPS